MPDVLNRAARLRSQLSPDPNLNCAAVISVIQNAAGEAATCARVFVATKQLQLGTKLGKYSTLARSYVLEEFETDNVAGNGRPRRNVSIFVDKVSESLQHAPFRFRPRVLFQNEK